MFGWIIRSAVINYSKNLLEHDKNTAVKLASLSQFFLDSIVSRLAEDIRHNGFYPANLMELEKLILIYSMNPLFERNPDSNSASTTITSEMVKSMYCFPPGLMEFQITRMIFIQMLKINFKNFITWMNFPTFLGNICENFQIQVLK